MEFINISSTEVLSKYDFGIIIAKILNLNKNILKKVSIDNLNLVKRPKFMSLCNKKISKDLDIKITPIEKQLSLLIKNFPHK